MRKLNQFQIFVNNPQGVYVGGQVVEGHVSLDLREPMKMKGIALRARGQTAVHWSESKMMTGAPTYSTSTSYYQAYENYFDEPIVLYGKGDNDTYAIRTHPAGKYKYPFRFRLPNGLPSSFEGSSGNVRYHITGTIVIPRKRDHTTKIVLTVTNLLDLNREPMALTVPKGQKSKTLCCLWCKSGPIEATCRLERRGYVPGESIVINAVITNGSNRKISCSYAELVQFVHFLATSGVRTDTIVVAEVQHPGIAPGETDVWSADRLYIPPIPPSRLYGCSIIDIEYILRFCVQPSGPAYTLQIPLKILIGSIPHHDVLGQNGNVGPSLSGTSAPFAPFISPPIRIPQPVAMLPPNLTPPSYAECISGKVNTRDEAGNKYKKGSGNTEYVPRYTHYTYDCGDSNLQNPEQVVLDTYMDDGDRRMFYGNDGLMWCRKVHFQSATRV